MIHRHQHRLQNVSKQFHEPLCLHIHQDLCLPVQKHLPAGAQASIVRSGDDVRTVAEQEPCPITRLRRTAHPCGVVLWRRKLADTGLQPSAIVKPSMTARFRPMTGRPVSKVEVHDNLRSIMSSSGGTSSTLLCVMATLAICLTVPAHGQVTLARPELLSGPWEWATASGVDGILVMIDQQTANGVTRETVQVRVYHRKDGHETKRWYVASSPRDGAAQFDGRRLVVADLTATFDPDTVRWTGEWVLDGDRRQVVLQRPHPAKGVSPNSLCGVWEGLPEPAPAPSIRIHIVQSSDGALTAWMDSSVFITERTRSQHYGRSMEVVSADPKSIILQNEAPNYQALGRFTGFLSSDGNTITGQWNGHPAVRIFRRIA